MSTDTFESDEIAILREAGIDPEPQAADESEGQAVPANNQQSEQPAPTQASTDASTQQPAAAAAPAPQGDVRAALRAARRAEQRARDEAARLKAENDALMAKLPGEQPEADPMSDEEIARAERDFPLLGRTARYVKAQMTAAPAAAASTQVDEFVPPLLPPVVQEIVDSSPDLLAWQHDPDQARFALAKSTDALLMQHPHWRDKPMAERLTEVVRRVRDELGAAAPAPSNPDPKALLAGVPRQSPETLSHIGGGGGKQPEAPASQRYMAMSEEAIVADLLRGG